MLMHNNNNNNDDNDDMQHTEDAAKHTKDRTHDALGRAPACRTPTSWEGAVHDATR